MLAAVGGVQEGERAALQPVVDAPRGLEFEGAGAGAADDVAGQADRGQRGGDPQPGQSTRHDPR